MSKTLDFLAVLYSKIISGSASDEDKAIYEANIAMSCIEENMLNEMIKRRAREMERE